MKDFTLYKNDCQEITGNERFALVIPEKSLYNRDGF